MKIIKNRITLVNIGLFGMISGFEDFKLDFVIILGENHCTRKSLNLRDALFSAENYDEIQLGIVKIWTISDRPYQFKCVSLS